MTPAGVRDGEPGALAGLCAVRGSAVLAYCRHVAGEADAVAATADAFARFRSAVVAADDLVAINPETLLVRATRHAAARCAGRATTGVCAQIPSLLAARAERSISLAELELLEGHLASCWACRAPVARFKAAERAYRDPPAEPPDNAVAGAIVAALASAAPVRGLEPRPAAPQAASPNGSGRAEHVPPATDGYGPDASRIGASTTEFRTLAEPEPEPAPAPEPERTEPEPGGARTGAIAALLGWLGLRSQAAPATAPAFEREPVAAQDEPPAPAPDPAQPRVSRSDSASGSALPRRRRERESASRAKGLLGLPILLPVVVIALALLAALFVAGVFGGTDPASSPATPAPAGVAPGAKTRPKVIVVPGAGDAGSAAVELEKARARARRKREQELERQGATPVAPPPPAAAGDPAPAAPPPRAAADEPAQPARDTGTSTRNPQIDAGTGATGAEGLPPADDPSTVPDLAPPAQPATPPG